MLYNDLIFNLSIKEDLRYPDMRVVQGDTKSHRFIVSLKDTVDKKRVAKDLTNANLVTFTFLKEDGNSVVGQGEFVDKANGIVQYVCGTQETTFPGKVKATIEVYGGGGVRLTSAMFDFKVVAQLNDGSGVESTTEYTALQTALNEVGSILYEEDTRKTNEIVRIDNENVRLQRMQELEGVNAVQFHERQNSFDAQLAQTVQEVNGIKENPLLREIYISENYPNNSVGKEGSIWLKLEEKQTPETINGLQYWLDISKVKTLYGGDKINQLVDMINFRTALQTSIEMQPTYRQNILNSRPIIRFDGNDYLENINLNVVIGTVIVVATKPPSGRAIFSTINSDNIESYLGSPAGDPTSFYWKPGETSVLTPLSNISAGYHVYHADRSSLFIDNVSVASGQQTSLKTHTKLLLGCRQNLTGFFDGDIAELLIYNRNLTNDERLSVFRYLSKKYSIGV